MTADPLAALRAALGESHARPAAAGDAIDAVVPRFVATPGSPEAVAATLRSAGDAGLAVVPRGGGSKLGWGAPPVRADLVLSTARLDSVLEHAAGDLVVRAQAGVRLDALQSRLAASGQWLALDPPEPGATLGGVVAAAASGPRRHRYGTPRDLLIGVSVALADGSVAKAGSKVVKNVAGYDLCKLFTGSFGTLGVIVETTFRLHPLPEARSLVTAAIETPRGVGEAVQALLHSGLVPSALELSWSGESDSHGSLAVLFEGVLASTRAQANQADRILAARGRSRIVPQESVGAEWLALTTPPGNDPLEDPGGSGSVWLKLSGVIASLPETIEAVRTVARERSLRFRIVGHAGIGVLGAGLKGAELAGLAAAVASLRHRLAPHTSVVIREAPAGLKRECDVWGDAGDALPLMKRVKERFDANGTLSPGRFVGGI